MAKLKHTGQTYGKRHRCIVCGRLHTWAKNKPCYKCRKVVAVSEKSGRAPTVGLNLGARTAKGLGFARNAGLR